MSITTKTGDDGTTELIGGRRVPKDHPLIECLGTIDELNAFLGDAKAALSGICKPGLSTGIQPDSAEIITGIQKDLFALAGILAGSTAQVPSEDRLHTLIIQLESALPPFASFAVPGANAISAKLHIARTVCRRAERQLVSLSRTADIESDIFQWFNRLSDLLFLLAQRHEQ